MPFNFTFPQVLVTGSATPHVAGPFTPAVGDSSFVVQLNMPNADFETAGNQVTILVETVAGNIHVRSETWKSIGGPLVHGGITDPPPRMTFDLTPYIGTALQAKITIPQTMTIGFTVTGS